MAQDLLDEIDLKVMQGELAKATESTGGVKLVWSTRLRTAAGKAHWIRQKGTKDQHNLQIELSTKIITDEGTIPNSSPPLSPQKSLAIASCCNRVLMVAKLRDTLAHEICHCALWAINKDPHSHHGKPFKEWSFLHPRHPNPYNS
jgi:hypothetical protein